MSTEAPEKQGFARKILARAQSFLSGFSSDPLPAPSRPGGIRGGHIEITVEDRLREVLRGRLFPLEVEQILRLALDGSLIWQQRLFERMQGSWPRLLKNSMEIQSAVERTPFVVRPFIEAGKKQPTASAKSKVDVVQAAIEGMRPLIQEHQEDFKGLLRAITSAIFYGHNVCEIYWEKRNGLILPRCVRSLPARYYAYPHLVTERDRLMLNPTGQVSNAMDDLQDFPPNQFVISIFGTSSAHPSVGAMFRALSAWWLASNYGLEWFMNFAQLFGIPWRIAKYADNDTKTYNALVSLMQDVGANGWAVVPNSAALELHDVSKNSAQLPQVVLMDNADKACDLLLLGQTLTSDTGKNAGSRALGQVHQDIRDEVMDGILDFCCRILNTQFCTAVLQLNFGETSECPLITAKIDQPQDEKALAERDQIVFQGMGLPVALSFLYEHNNIPQPDDDDELYVPPTAQPMQKDPEESFSTPGVAAVRASAAGKPLRPNLERLVTKVMEDLTGVSAEFLKPVRPVFQDLIALAKDSTVSDEHFVAALRTAEKKLPSVFRELNVKALEKALSDAMAAGLINGITDRRLTPLVSRSEASFKPPEEVAHVVQEAIRHHPNGTPVEFVTLARAQRIARREPLSIETIERLAEYFQGSGETGSKLDAMHGGEAGKAWVGEVLRDFVRGIKQQEVVE